MAHPGVQQGPHRFQAQILMRGRWHEAQMGHCPCPCAHHPRRQAPPAPCTAGPFPGDPAPCRPLTGSLVLDEEQLEPLLEGVLVDVELHLDPVGRSGRGLSRGSAGASHSPGTSFSHPEEPRGQTDGWTDSSRVNASTSDGRPQGPRPPQAPAGLPADLPKPQGSPGCPPGSRGPSPGGHGQPPGFNVPRVALAQAPNMSHRLYRTF